MRNSHINSIVKSTLVLVACTAWCICSFADETGAVTDAETKAQKRAAKAEQKRLNSIWKTQSPVEGFESVDMFDAMKSGDIDVVIKTRSSANANLMFTNKSNRPLAIQIPPAFAGVPVLKQGLGGGGGGFGGGGGGLGGGGRGGGGVGGGQGIGGGGGTGGGGGGFGGGGGRGGGGGGGIFNIPPGRVGKININTVCLEHGKPDPRPQMEYQVVPIEELSTDPHVHQIIQLLANDAISQNVAQAAAWHKANSLSWEFLLTKNRIERMDGYYERYFSPDELMTAHQVVEFTKQRVKQLAQQKSFAPKSSGEIIAEEEAGKR